MEKVGVNGRRRMGGVGIAVRHGAGLEVEELNVNKCEMSEDIMAAHMEYKCEGKVERFVLSVCYMTVEGTGAKEENRKKYEILRKLIEVNKKEWIIIMGDMNGHFGILKEEVNVNGQLLLEFMEESGLENLNVKMTEGQMTWAGREDESVIDYILVNEHATKCVLDIWVDEDSLIDVSSDHNMIVVNYVGKRNERKVRSRSKVRRWRLKEAEWRSFKDGLVEMKLSEDTEVDDMNEEFRNVIIAAVESKAGFTQDTFQWSEAAIKKWSK